MSAAIVTPRPRQARRAHWRPVTAQTLIDATGATPEGRGSYAALCPVHESGRTDVSSPSLVLRFHDNGTAELFCGSRGCARRDLLAALDLSDVDLQNVTNLDAVETAPGTGARVEQGEHDRRRRQALTRTFIDTVTAEPDCAAAQYVRRRYGLADGVDLAAYGVGSDADGRLVLVTYTADGRYAWHQTRDEHGSPKWRTAPNGSGGSTDVTGFVGPYRGTGPVYVTEGPGDALALALTIDDGDVLAVRGGALGRYVVERSEDVRGRTVVLCGDGDPTGDTLNRSATEALVAAGHPPPIVLAMPEGSDVDEVRAADPAGWPHTLARMVKEATPMHVTSEPHDVTHEAGSDPDTAGRFGAAEVVAFVQERFILGRSSDGKLIAIPKTGTAIARTVRALQPLVQAAVFSELGKTPSATTMATAFGVLEGIASASDPVDMHLRAAFDARARVLHIDLGDAAQTIVRVDADGWRVTHGPTPIFRRSSGTNPLPMPTQPADDARARFAEIVGLSVASTEFRLLWGWLVAVWFADIARPILWTVGEQGSGKTTRALFALSLVDPVKKLGGNPGRNERDDSTAASNRYVPTYDNLRSISEATSDWICRLVTGVSIDRRALYSDEGVVTSEIQRTALATSITLPYGLGADAIERLIILTLHRIPEHERTSERELLARFEQIRPQVLGALLDDVAATIAHLDDEPPAALPRMADYARTLHALDAATGGEYAAAYVHATETAMLDAVESDPWLSAVVALARHESGQNTPRPYAGRFTATGWEGTPADLVEAVTPHIDEHAGKHPTSRGAWAALVAKSVPLRAAGVAADRRKSNGTRLITLDVIPEDLILAA